MRLLIVTLFILVTVSATLFAQEAELFANIAQNGPSSGAYPRNFAAMGSTLYFLADDGIHGYELWKTEGTAETTKLVVDLTPGPASSFIYPLKAAGSYFYFALQLEDQTQLWAVDFQDHPHKVFSFPKQTYLDREETIEWHGMFFFVISQPVLLQSIWKTQGTPTSTIQLTSNNLSGRLGFASTTKFVFFPGTDDAHGTELWRTDGTIPGTKIVKDINPGNMSSELQAIQAFGDNVVFAANDGVHGSEPWRSDGTEANTSLIVDLEPGGTGTDIQQFTPLRGQYLVFGYRRFWSMDQLFQVTTLKDFRSTSNVFSNGQRAFFSGLLNASGEELWTTDGTQAGTYLIQDLVPGVESSHCEILGVANQKVFFKANSFDLDNGLYVSDGTKNAIQIVKRTYNIEELGSAVNYAYFTNFDAIAGDELWRSDGTEAGTILVKDINIDDGSSSPYSLVALDQELYFLGRDGDRHGLWRTNGSSMPEFLQEGAITNLCKLNSNTVMYSSSDGLHRVYTGSTPEMIRNFDRIGYIKAALGKIFFYAEKQGTNSLYWVSDGTSERTKALNGLPRYSNIFSGVTRNGYLYFPSCSSGFCSKLWRTNGDATIQVLNFPESYISYLFTGGGLIHFVLYKNNAFEIWSSNGTAAGTKPIAVSPIRMYPRSVVYPNLYFTRGSNSANLWSFNLQTKKFSELVQSNDPYPDLDFLSRIENVSLFYYDAKLWRTDGTPAGTFPIRDVRFAYSGRNVNGKVYFSGDTTSYGQEVWVTDGTSEGTRMLFDIYQGAYSSYPSYFTPFQDWIYFSARDHDHGQELWVFKP
jgi:ELWxxDGT repeat protein